MTRSGVSGARIAVWPAGKLGAALADEPADELAKDRRAVGLGDIAEGCPQLGLDVAQADQRHLVPVRVSHRSLLDVVNQKTSIPAIVVNHKGHLNWRNGDTPMSNSAASKRRSRAHGGGEGVLFDLLCWHVRPQRGAAIVLGLPGAASCVPDAMFTEEKVAAFYDGPGQPSEKDRKIAARLVDLGWLVFRMREHEDVTEIVALVVDAVRRRQAELDAGRAEHTAGHEAHAWCERCEQWPHSPWPIGIDGWCLRCLVHADEHADIYGPEFAPEKRRKVAANG